MLFLVYSLLIANNHEFRFFLSLSYSYILMNNNSSIEIKIVTREKAK